MSQYDSMRRFWAVKESCEFNINGVLEDRRLINQKRLEIEALEKRVKARLDARPSLIQQVEGVREELRQGKFLRCMKELAVYIIALRKE